MPGRLSHSEENYLKQIYHLSENAGSKATTNALADRMSAKASSITDMLKRLCDKELIRYQRYQGCELTDAGKKIAVQIVRKHRLWETFLVEKLGFRWGEVHDVAEQLEHISSGQLIERLDAYLNHPRFDPHGDPIPDKKGTITDRRVKKMLSDAPLKNPIEVIAVNEDSDSLLAYLDRVGISIGTRFRIVEKYAFDQSVKLRLSNGAILHISGKAAENILVRNTGKS